MTRKLIALFSALLIAASFCACNGNGGEEDSTNDNNINISGDEEPSGGDSTGGETGEDITSPEDNTKNPGDLSYTDKNDKIYVLAPSGALNLRTADYEIKKSVETGTELSRIAISTDGVWSKIVYEEETLYVNNKYITSLADLDAGFTAVEKTLVSVGALKCHIAPEQDEAWQMDIKIVNWYEEGDEVKVVAENTTTGWYKVEFTAYGGATAYGYVVSDAKYYQGSELETGSTETIETTTSAAQG